MGRAIGVVGTTVLGVELAFAFAKSLSKTGGRVTLWAATPSDATGAQQQLASLVSPLLARKKLSQRAADKLTHSVTITHDLSQLGACALIVDAVSLSGDQARYQLTTLRGVISGDTIVGFLCPLDFGQLGDDHNRCVGLWPALPASETVAIEVLPSPNPETTTRAVNLLSELGKVPVIVRHTPCAITAAIHAGLLNEACRIIAERLATIHQIERVVELVVGGIGPFAAHDRMGGNARSIQCLTALRRADNNDGFAPTAFLLENAGTEWHRVPAETIPPMSPHRAQIVGDRLLATVFLAGLSALEHERCTPSDLDWLSRAGMGFYKGVLVRMRELGKERVEAICRSFLEGNPQMKAPSLLPSLALPEFYGDITASTDDEGIAVLTVRRPKVLNALSGNTIEELKSIFVRLKATPAVKAVVLTSAGGALAGADIKELAQLTDEAATVERARLGQALTSQIESLGKPVVCAVNGPVLGGGAELAMSCWQRVCGPNLMAGQPEVHLGLIPGYGGTQRLPRLVGFERAWQMLRSGEPLGADEACELGWAHGTPVEDPVGAAKALIREHFASDTPLLTPLDPAPVAVPDPQPTVDIGHHSRAIDAILVEVIVEGLQRPLAEGLELEAQGFGRCYQTEDMRIGLQNFMENGPRTNALFMHK